MPNRIKVLHIIKSLGRGGAEMLLPETLRLHDKQLFDFHYIYFLPWKNQMVESIEQHSGKVACFSSRNNIVLLTKVWEVARYVRDHNIQIIHAHLPWAGILARLVGKLTGLPVIYTEHNKQERYHFITRVLNLTTMKMLNEVIAVSEDVSESIKKNKPDLKMPVRTILNGVNTANFINQQFDGNTVRVTLGIPAECQVIGTIAVFRFQKRLDVWMDLAAAILRKHSSVHFILVGGGPLLEELLKKRDELGLKDRIHLPGVQTEVRPYLASFDIFMMTSVFEGLPLALLEAMAMERAVITTDAGGIKEVIRHEVDGLMCSVDDPGKLVEFATILLENPALRVKYGVQARNRVVENFSLKAMVDALEERYRQWAVDAKN